MGILSDDVVHELGRHTLHLVQVAHLGKVERVPDQVVGHVALAVVRKVSPADALQSCCRVDEGTVGDLLAAQVVHVRQVGFLRGKFVYWVWDYLVISSTYKEERLFVGDILNAQLQMTVCELNQRFNVGLFGGSDQGGHNGRRVVVVHHDRAHQYGYLDDLAGERFWFEARPLLTEVTQRFYQQSVPGRTFDALAHVQHLELNHVVELEDETSQKNYQHHADPNARAERSYERTVHEVRTFRGFEDEHQPVRN